MVVAHAFKHGNHAAAQHFSDDPVRVRYWMKQQEQLRATEKDCRAFRGPKEGKFPAVEKEVLSYVQRLTSESCAASHELLQNHARATARSQGIPACDFGQQWLDDTFYETRRTMPEKAHDIVPAVAGRLRGEGVRLPPVFHSNPGRKAVCFVSNRQ